jgi:transcriptional regulator with XRE-family HTH domain
MANDDSIGRRVARWRDIAGMTQQELADRLGLTREYINMIENGRRAVTKRSLLYGLAGALQVSITDLTAQPVMPRTPAERLAQAAVPAIRRALDAAPDPEQPPRPLSHWAEVADTAMAARMAADFGWSTLGQTLPGLMTATAALAEDGDDQAGVLHVRACVMGALALKPLGHVDLARVLADRAEAYSQRYAEPAHAAATAFAKAQVMLSAGSRAEALTVAERAADAVAPVTTDDGRTWYGMLHLHAALCAASVGQPTSAAAHLDEAAEVADQVTGDPWRMEFGPANVALWRVGVALENGEAGRAPELARRVDQTGLRTVDRRVRLRIDTARGWYAEEDYARATRSLLEAHAIAPAAVRMRSAVREMAGQMARDAPKRGGGAELRYLVTRLGVDPWAPPEDAGSTHPAD